MAIISTLNLISLLLSIVLTYSAKFEFFFLPSVKNGDCLLPSIDSCLAALDQIMMAHELHVVLSLPAFPGWYCSEKE